MTGNQRSRRSLPQLPVEFEVQPRGRGRPRNAAENVADAAQGQDAGNNYISPLPPAAPPVQLPAPQQQPPAPQQQPPAPPVPAQPPAAAPPAVSGAAPSRSSPAGPPPAFSFGDFHPWAYPPGYPAAYYHHGSYLPPNLHMPPVPSQLQQQRAEMQVPVIGAQAAAAMGGPTVPGRVMPPAAAAAAGPAVPPAPAAVPPAPAVPVAPAAARVLQPIPAAAVPAAALGATVPPAAPAADADELGERPQQTITRLRRLLTDSQRANAELSRYTENLERQLEYLQRNRRNNNNNNNNRYEKKKFNNNRYKGV